MKYLLNTLIICLFLASCSSNKLDVDISNIEVNIDIQRMEQDFRILNNGNYEELNNTLLKKYGFLYELWFTRMIGEVSPYDNYSAQSLKHFLNHPDIIEILEEIDKEFKDFNSYFSQFEKCFKYYKYYFPDSTLPNIVTFYSNFNANILPLDNTLAIGLDMYLGPEHHIIKAIPKDVFPQYLKDRMDSKYLIADAMKFFLLNKFGDKEQEDFLTTIINLGKIMYLLDCVLPFENDAIKMGYTEAQLKWCQNFELKIWETIIDEKTLYTKDKLIINNYLNEGPFTKGLPHESPSRVGVWLGWQMVRDYMHQTNVSLSELLAQKSAKVILKSYSQGDR